MRICFLVSEYFAWGAYGGYGTITRSVAEGLARRGHEVFALVPRRTEEAKQKQRDIEHINGVTVIALPHSYFGRWRFRSRYSDPAADIYVSTDARFDSWMAMKANPESKHCVWLIDPMRFGEFWQLHADSATTGLPRSRPIARLIFEGLAWFGRSAARRADALISQTVRMTREGAAFFGVERTVEFAPSPVSMPEAPIEKAAVPTILFLGRFDRQKQPEAFFQLAAQFPAYQFVAAGKASDPALDSKLRARYAGVANLDLVGLATGPEKDALLRSAWILCNTSLREGLPRSLQEALSYECALLAGVDPDDLVSKFGVHVPDRDFEAGLNQLLERDRWKTAGQAGRRYVAETYELEGVLDTHERIYGALLRKRSGERS